MNIYRGCIFPDDLLYDVAQDVWVRYQDGVATMGMTDPAQSRCGKFVAVQFRTVGRVIAKGKVYATVESGKWVGPFPAVLTGEIIETNEAGFQRDILLANRDPYGAGWLVKIRPTKWEEERANLLDAAAAFQEYRKKIEALDLNCMRCMD
ncbi:MAG: glycine cleavage system protein H [Chloroflexi bacterium]|nr:glycine cleavage system protein H [Chloroflexota bacterium]